MSMTVKELQEWLSKFHDQDAIVQIVQHKSGRGYYEQGGTAYETPFVPEKHTEYVDLRGNPYIKENHSWYNRRTLLLGELNG